ncbi:MAG: hypothetical protein VZR11_05720 [Succinimonas sp.]|nr:hypothetical protein [Succinimonas sp.]
MISLPENRSSRNSSAKCGLSGGFLELTPAITDFRDDVRGSPAITESVFLRTRLEYPGSGTGFGYGIFNPYAAVSGRGR